MNFDCFKMNNEQLFNLETLLVKWASYTVSSFKGVNTVDDFRSLQISNNGDALFDKVKMAVYGLGEEKAKVFDSMSYSLDYDYLPCWVIRHRNGENFYQEMNDFVLYGQVYTVPSREVLKEIHEGFLVFYNYLRENGVEPDLVLCFMTFLEKCVELSG